MARSGRFVPFTGILHTRYFKSLVLSRSLMQNYRRAGTSSVGYSTTNYVSFDAAVKYGPKFYRLDDWHSHKS